MAEIPPRVNVLGVGVHALNLKTAVAAMRDAIAKRIGGYVCVTGVHGICEAQSDPDFRTILNQAFLNTPDGMPLVWIGKASGFAHVTRVYGPDLLLEVCAASEAAGWKHFFYGGGEGTADLLASTLQVRFPKLNVVGTHTPPFRPLTENEFADFQANIANLRPDIIWVGLSTPKQERFMSSSCAALGVPVMVGIGAAFDLISGKVKQAPRWLQRTGFEWLYRLAMEPGRLWKRYLRNNPLFLGLLFLQLTGLRKYKVEERQP